MARSGDWRDPFARNWPLDQGMGGEERFAVLYTWPRPLHRPGPRQRRPARSAGVSLVFGTAYMVVNAVVDLLQAWADPRVSL